MQSSFTDKMNLLICSSHQEFLSHTAKMINQFHKCGCNRSLIEQQIDKANLQEREQIFLRKRGERTTGFVLNCKQFYYIFVSSLQTPDQSQQ